MAENVREEMTSKLTFLNYVKLKKKDVLVTAMEKQSAKKTPSKTCNIEAQIFRDKIVFTDSKKPKKKVAIREIIFDRVERILPEDDANRITAGIKGIKEDGVCSFAFPSSDGYMTFIENLYDARGWVTESKNSTPMVPVQMPMEPPKLASPAHSPLMSTTTSLENISDKLVDLSEGNDSILSTEINDHGPRKPAITYVRWSYGESNDSAFQNSSISNFHCPCCEKVNKAKQAHQISRYPLSIASQLSTTPCSCMTEPQEIHEDHRPSKGGTIYSGHRLQPPNISQYSWANESDFSSNPDQQGFTVYTDPPSSTSHVQVQPRQHNQRYFSRTMYRNERDPWRRGSADHITQQKYRDSKKPERYWSRSSSGYTSVTSGSGTSVELTVDPGKAYQYVQNQTRVVTGQLNVPSVAPARYRYS